MTIIVICAVCAAAYALLCLQAARRDRATGSQPRPVPRPPGQIPTQRPRPGSAVRP